MKKAILLLIYFPTFLYGQNNVVRFTNNLSWEQVLNEAKKVNKYIFVDCYASWCGPCKRMDKEVYNSDTISNLLNSEFISLKLQFDTTQNDNQETKGHYLDAQKMQQEFQIFSYPTFLFFSPEGKIVHRAIGYRNIKGFKNLLADATNPNKQLYTVLELYNKGDRSVSNMHFLMQAAISINDKSLYEKIANDYTHEYLVNQSPDEIFKKDNLLLLSQVVKSSTDNAFILFRDNSRKIDSVMWKGYTEEFVNRIVYKEEVIPKLKAKVPFNMQDWNQLSEKISKNYSKQCAKTVVERGIVNWFGAKKDYKNFTKYAAKYFGELIPKDDKINEWYYINDNAWNIFLYSNNKNELNTALLWVMKIVNNDKNSDHRNPNILDTYANLLYKLGKKSEALKWEEMAAQTATGDDQIQQALGKMQRGEQTWPLIHVGNTNDK